MDWDLVERLDRGAAALQRRFPTAPGTGSSRAEFEAWGYINFSAAYRETLWADGALSQYPVTGQSYSPHGAISHLDGACWALSRALGYFEKANESKEFKEFMTNRGFGIKWADAAGFTQFMAAGDAAMGVAMKAAGLAK